MEFYVFFLWRKFNLFFRLYIRLEREGKGKLSFKAALLVLSKSCFSMILTKEEWEVKAFINKIMIKRNTQTKKEYSLKGNVEQQQR